MSSVSVLASIDIDEVLEQLDDDWLLDECESRGLSSKIKIDLADLLRLLRDGEVLDAILRLERELGISRPSDIAIASLKNGTHPFLKLNEKS